jgi:PAS domain-containing protein
MKVLLIDNDPAMAEGLRGAFAERRLAPELIGVDSPAEALRRLRQDQAAVSVVVANPDGWPGRLSQAVSELKAAAPDVPLLALLEARTPFGREEAVLAGFDDAFAKHPRIHQTLARLLMEITERFALGRQQLKLSQARRDAELLLTTVLAASDAAVVILDGDGQVTVANAQFAQMVGRPLADILSRPLWPLLHPDGAASLRSVLQDGQGSGPVGLTVTVLGRGAEIPTHVRALARELREQRRLAVVSFRPATAGSGPTSSLLRPREPAPEPTAEQLSATLRLLRTTPVVARIRLGECNRLLSRAGALPPEAMATLRLTLRRTLHELLTDEDFVAGAGEDTYLLLADESVLRAMRRLGRTIPALRAALLNSPELAHDLLGMGGAPLVEQLDQLCDLQVLVAPVELAPEDIGYDDPATLMAGRLQAQEAALGSEVLRGLNELRMHAVCDLRMVQDQDGAPSALCLACINEAASGRFAELTELAHSRPELAFQLALLHLELAVETLAREVDRDSALAVIDLHFSVLGHRRLAERSLERCRALPPKIVRALVVNLLGVPSGAYAPKFARVTGALQELFRLRALTVHDPRTELVDLDLARIGLVIVDFRDLMPLFEERSDVIQALVRRVHRSQTRLLVRRVPRGLASELRERLAVDLTSSA